MELNETRSCVNKLYLDTLFAATEESCICQFQRFLGLCTLLTIIFQPTKLSFVNGKSLKSLFWTQVSLKFAWDTLIQNPYNQVEAKLKKCTKY